MDLHGGQLEQVGKKSRKSQKHPKESRTTGCTDKHPIRTKDSLPFVGLYCKCCLPATCTVCTSLSQKPVHESPQSSAPGSASQQKNGDARFIFSALIWRERHHYLETCCIPEILLLETPQKTLITAPSSWQRAEIIGGETRLASLDVALVVAC